MEDSINALDEIHKGCCMGMDAIYFASLKIKSDKFKKEIKRQYKDYEKIAKEINKIYSKYNDGKPQETSNMNKAMLRLGIEMKTMTDNSDSKIADLLIEGVNMGIIEGRKILNNKNIDRKIHNIISEYVNMQEKNLEVLKTYL